MVRPVVRVYIAVSLDGCNARDNGALDWLEPMQVAGEDYGYAEFYAGIDALIIGRATYDSVLAFPQWPFGGKPVTVLTHRALAPRHGELVHAGALQPLVERFAAAGLRNVYLDGGQAIRQGLQENLVDELTLNIVPVLLGRGRPLFAPTLPGSDWTLVSSCSFASGLVQNRYRRR